MTGVLFLLAIFLSPIAGIIPAVATAPALILVGYLMFTQVKDIDVSDVEDGIPALLTMILMPLTYDITVGIGAGFISWVMIKVVRGKAREVHPLMWVVAGLFLVFFLQGWNLPSSNRAAAGGLTSRRHRTGGPAPRGRPPVRRSGLPSAAMFHRTVLRRWAARDLRAPARRRARCPSPRTCSPARGWSRPPRRASPTSWSTSRSRGRRAIPSSRAISEAVEGVGGSANAATDRESTVYWVRVPRREATTAMGVLGELIVRPRLDDEDIDQERTVIVEEIRSYLDDPSEYAQMLIQQAMFGDGPLGREICGDEAGIRALPTQAIRDFWHAMYRPSNTVVAVAGDLSHDEAVGSRRRRSGPATASSRGSRPRPALPAGPRVLTGRRDTTQAQLAIAVPGAPPRPPRRLEPLGPQRRAGRRDVVSRLFLARARGEGPRLRRLVGHRRVRGRRRARGVGRAWTRAGCPRDRGDPRSSSRASSTSPSRATSWRRRRRTCPAASSCGWTTRATSRRGSAARRRSTTACSRSTRRSRGRGRRSPTTSAASGAAVPRRGAADGRRRAGQAPARPGPPPPAAAMTDAGRGLFDDTPPAGGEPRPDERPPPTSSPRPTSPPRPAAARPTTHPRRLRHRSAPRGSPPTRSIPGRGPRPSRTSGARRRAPCGRPAPPG